MDGEKELRKVTLCLLVKDNKILLAMKKRGFGVNKWNGVGGKLNKGESVEDAMIRETEEEIYCTPKEYYKTGVIRFFFDEKPEFNQEMHIFICRKWEGEPQESEEMLPRWFNIKDIPFNEMWEDDKMWLPSVLINKKVNATFFFNVSQNIRDYSFEAS